MDLVAGVQIRARGLIWDVTETEQLGEQRRLRVRCRAGDLTGLEWDLLHPAEPVEILHSTPCPENAGPIAAWRLRHMACLLDQIPGPADRLSLEPGRLNIEPYQLVPLMRALELPRPRLLLADGVGLGKTIQAGLIAAELIARRRAHRILIIVPAGALLAQWDQEMRARFGLRFTRLTDRAELRRERLRLELGGNPFASVALCLTSLDFAKQEHILEELDRTAWDLVIIDEAHHCISDSASPNAEATQRRRLAEVVARRTDGLLLLSATPHDGHDLHFASLIALLDPSLVDEEGGLVGQAYRRHVVRRLKSHLRPPGGGELFLQPPGGELFPQPPGGGGPLFHDRKLVPVRVDALEHEVRAFHVALAALVVPRLHRPKAEKRPIDALAFVSLLKRSGSTIAACLATLRVVAERYADTAANDAATRRERDRALRAYRRRMQRFGVLDTAEEQDIEQLEAECMAAELRASDGVEPALLNLMELGKAALPHDPKIDTLMTEIRLIRLTHPNANVLVYTEYADSQRAVVQALRAAPGVAGEILAISGIDSEADRMCAVDRFSDRDGLVLVSTDSLAEGLNLHRRCFHLIHLDLPYNPNRLEQRNGRIDRYGQRHAPDIRYLFLAGTFEERVLLRLIAKYEKAKSRLTYMPNTFGLTASADVLAPGLIAGFAERQPSLFDSDRPPIRTVGEAAENAESEAFRELLREIDRAYDSFDHMAAKHGWLAERGSGVQARPNAPNPGFDLLAFAAAAFGVDSEVASDVVTFSRVATGKPDWVAELEGLPGFDPESGVLRVTRDPDRLRDEAGASLGFLGRAHPLVRRTINRIVGDADIGRVAATYSQVHAAPAVAPTAALLLTFVGEIQDGIRTVLRHPIGVLLSSCGTADTLVSSNLWLSLALPTPDAPPPDIWRRMFQSWAEPRLAHAASRAGLELTRIADAFTGRLREACERDDDGLLRWLRSRATAICGAAKPNIADLFGESATAGDWRSLSDPLQRLAGFATDAAEPAVKRREANAAIEICQRAYKNRDLRLKLSVPILRPIGMLMLVPAPSA